MVQKLHRRKTQAQRGVGNESRVRDQGTDRRHSRVHCRRVRTRGGNKAPLRLFTVVRVGKPCTRTLMQLLVDGLGKRALHALGRRSIEKCWAGNQLRGELDIKSLQCVDRSRQLRKPDGQRGRIRLRTQASAHFLPNQTQASDVRSGGNLFQVQQTNPAEAGAQKHAQSEQLTFSHGKQGHLGLLPGEGLPNPGGTGAIPTGPETRAVGAVDVQPW